MHVKRRILVIPAILLLVIAGITVAYAAVLGPDGVIHACYNNKSVDGKHALFVIDGQCPEDTTSLDWNQQGPPGPQGSPGVGLTSFDSLSGTPCRVGDPMAGTISISYAADGTATIKCNPNPTPTLTATPTSTPTPTPNPNTTPTPTLIPTPTPTPTLAPVTLGITISNGSIRCGLFNLDTCMSTGTVTASDGIGNPQTCSSSCPFIFPANSNVTLTAQPGQVVDINTGQSTGTLSHFLGWQGSGTCLGSNPTCTITLPPSGLLGVTALFGP